MLDTCREGDEKKAKEEAKASPGEGSQAAVPPASALAEATTPEVTTTPAGMPTHTVNALAKALERTPKPVQMPSGPLPNANTVTLWMSTLAGSLAASSVYTDFEEYEWIFECQIKTKMELAAQSSQSLISSCKCPRQSSSLESSSGNIRALQKRWQSRADPCQGDK